MQKLMTELTDIVRCKERDTNRERGERDKVE